MRFCVGPYELRFERRMGLEEVVKELRGVVGVCWGVRANVREQNVVRGVFQ